MASSSIAQRYRCLQIMGLPAVLGDNLALRRWSEGLGVGLERPDRFNGDGCDIVLSWVASACKPEFPKALMPASGPLCQLAGSGGDQEELNPFYETLAFGGRNCKNFTRSRDG